MSDAHAMNLLGSALSRALRAEEQRRRTYLEATAERQAKYGTVQGFVDVTGPGETVVTVSFPVMFMEKPNFSAGLELADNNWLTLENFPVWSATVGQWTINRSSSGVNRYVGAQIGLVLFSPAMRGVLHYSFVAKSFTNPSNRDPSLGEVL